MAPLTAIGQGSVLIALLLLPEVAAVAAGAALALLAAAVASSLALSATGAAVDPASSQAALAAVLLVAWLSGSPSPSPSASASGATTAPPRTIAPPGRPGDRGPGHVTPAGSRILT